VQQNVSTIYLFVVFSQIALIVRKNGVNGESVKMGKGCEKKKWWWQESELESPALLQIRKARVS